MNIVIKPLDQAVQDCSIGCEMPVYRIHAIGWDQICSNGGAMTRECGDETIVKIDIQPQSNDKGGERIQCQVNGITMTASYQFYFEPQENIINGVPYHLTTPNSEFVSGVFDAKLFYGGWNVIKWLGQEWLITEIKNWTDSCGGECDVVVLQEGVIVPLKSCFRRKDTTLKDDDFCLDSDSDAWVRIDEL